MKPRDLSFPEDARRVYNSLVHGLEYDAAFAILADRVARLPIDSLPKNTLAVRFAPFAAENVVHKEFAGFCARLATISMVARFDRSNHALLLQRRFLEALVASGRPRMPGPELLMIMRAVRKEIRHNSPVKVVRELLVRKPSPELLSRATWLSDIYRVRNCLAHREGIVQMEDTEEADSLHVGWLEMKAKIEGTELTAVPYTVEKAANLEVRIEESERTWKIGDPIHLTAADSQDIAVNLALLESRILAEFETEMNEFLKNARNT